jgi:arylsulfatase A-like enzyme
MADYFTTGGYRTGLFGKWHLGDNYPFRPTDRGFQTVVAHKGGGIGQTPDFWGNNYFDDTYFHNNEPVVKDGYCTDIWFNEAMNFIEDAGDKPFFVCLATNAPHDPYLVPQRYMRPYADNPHIPYPAFYGMIASIDENFGRLRGFLQERDLERNTILIFMTDNGSSGGCTCDSEGFFKQGFNAGMRGKKGSYYEGGHRVPFFLRWPEGGIGVGKNAGRDISEMSFHIDLLPTLCRLCTLEPPANSLPVDGVDVSPLLLADSESLESERIEFNQFDMVALDVLERWNTLVMSSRWRLVRGEELYDIENDPGQEVNVAADYPVVVGNLRKAHDAWFDEIKTSLAPYCRIVLGSDHENPTRLDAFDVLGDLPYVQSLVAAGKPCSGRWAVTFAQAGRYRFTLRRWPTELGLPLGNDLSPEMFDRLIVHWEETRSRIIRPVSASLTMFDREHVQAVHPADCEATFELDLHSGGDTELQAFFNCADDEQIGAYYLYVERL